MYEWSFTVAAYTLTWSVLLAYTLAVGARTRRARRAFRVADRLEVAP